jgi:predicted small secreted protein
MTLRDLRFIVLPLALMAAGCNTVAGFGQDVESAGEGVTHAADETSEEIDEATD